jgi:hypothetical protein
MVKNKQKQVGYRQRKRRKRYRTHCMIQRRQANDIESPDLHDKVPDPPKGATGTQEMASYPQDENPDL